MSCLELCICMQTQFHLQLEITEIVLQNVVILLVSVILFLTSLLLIITGLFWRCCAV